MGSGVFAAPRWLRELGTAAWLLLGVAVVLIGALWLLSLVHTIAIPLLTATLIAAVLSPVVSWLHRHGLPRGLAAALLLVILVVLGGLLLLAIVAGIANESHQLSTQLTKAADRISGWLQDLGVNQSTADSAKQDASSSASTATHALLNGIAHGLESLASLAVFASFTVISLFFMLKD